MFRQSRAAREPRCQASLNQCLKSSYDCYRDRENSHMSRAIYFDCFSGISGDMALGALIDAGLPVEQLRAELEKLELSGWALDAEPGMRSFLAGTRAIVHAPEQATHRHLADVRQIIEASRLSDDVKQRSIVIFTLLAEAEGRVHGIGAEQVHFHEVGALDAIIDVVG